MILDHRYLRLSIAAVTGGDENNRKLPAAPVLETVLLAPGSQGKGAQGRKQQLNNRQRCSSRRRRLLQAGKAFPFRRAQLVLARCEEEGAGGGGDPARQDIGPWAGGWCIGLKSGFDASGGVRHVGGMTSTLEQLTLGALQLPGRQRLALAGFLLETTDAALDADTDEAWEREIQDRLLAVDAGRVAGIPWEQVLLEADKRLAS